ncbi:MAG: hypothetical protein ACI8S6_003769 [Myxococcota bacterium]|jgi:hypothetical protein
MPSPVLHAALPLITLLAIGCTSDKNADEDTGPQGIALLGGNTHAPGDLLITTIIDGLDMPRDAAFNPEADDELWIIDDGAGEMVVVSGANTADQSDRGVKSSGSTHFFARPAALAFGDTGTLATAQDEDEITQSTTPADFMGPTLWPSDLSDFDAGHGSHLDMLHNTPNGVGIAWETENVYWIFDGYHGSLTRYDFGGDHGQGGSDHSDGEIARYAEGELGYQDDVSSHLAYDADSGLLYAADTENGRILVLDTTSGEDGGGYRPNYDGADQYRVENTDTWALIEEPDLTQPSGLEIHDGVIYVSDYASGTIFAFDLDGEVIDWLDTGLGEESLMGMSFHPDGSLYVVDSEGGAIHRIATK